MKRFQLQPLTAVFVAALLGGCAANSGALPNGASRSTTWVRHASGSGAYSTIFSLPRDDSEGYAPTTVPYVDASGALYGQTDSGGSGSYGTVFKLTPNGSTYTETTLHNFTGGSGDGQDPFGELTGDSSGAIYGTTYGGLLYGTVFKLTPSGSSYNYDILYTFQAGHDGADPNGGVIVGKKGVLFGTTSVGGNYGCYGRGCGTVFKMVRNNNKYVESVIYTFKETNDGATPIGSLVMDKKGALYGTTEFGGSAGQGTVFRLKPSNGGYKETILHNFTGPNGDGQTPEGTLTLDKHGNLYGTANTGGISSCECGAVYTLRTNGKKYHILYSFPGGSGGSALRAARIALGANGILYVTAYQGGNDDVGVLVALTPGGSGYTANVLHSFADYPDGAGPYDGVVADGRGHYFGTTIGGGSGQTGTVFEFTP